MEVFLDSLRYRTASPVSGLQVRGQEARKATSHGDQDFVQQKTTVVCGASCAITAVLTVPCG